MVFFSGVCFLFVSVKGDVYLGIKRIVRVIGVCGKFVICFSFVIGERQLRSIDGGVEFALRFVGFDRKVIIDLCVQSPAYTTMISEKPQASRVSRYQAETHASVTNLRHETIHLSDLQQRVLRLLDGTRDYKSIVSALVADVSKSELVIQEKGRPVTDSIGIQAAISRMLDENLLELAKHALLLG